MDLLEFKASSGIIEEKRGALIHEASWINKLADAHVANFYKFLMNQRDPCDPS